MNFERDGIPGRQYAPIDPGNKKHIRTLVSKLTSYKVSVKLRYSQIVSELSDLHSEEKGMSASPPITDQYLRKFVSRPETVNPGGDVLNLIYRYLDKANAWDRRSALRNEISQIEDAQYFALLNFFDVPEKTTNNLMRRLPGIYRVYRPLLTHPGYFVVGVVFIEPDHRRGVLKFHEHDVLQKMNGREAKQVTLEGYAFKKSNFITFLASDTAKNSIHLTTFSSCELEDDQYTVLFGGFFDTLGKAMYSGQVFMERVRGKEATKEEFDVLSTESRCVSRSDLPPSIEEFFSGGAKSGDVALF